jgi:hypothetical protein
MGIMPGQQVSCKGGERAKRADEKNPRASEKARGSADKGLRKISVLTPYPVIVYRSEDGSMFIKTNHFQVTRSATIMAVVL